MMTSSMTSQGGLKFGPLYSFINEITTFSCYWDGDGIDNVTLRLWKFDTVGVVGDDIMFHILVFAIYPKPHRNHIILKKKDAST